MKGVILMVLYAGSYEQGVIRRVLYTGCYT